MKLKHLLCSVGLCALLLPSAALADWSANFVPPSGPNAPLRIDLPDDLDIITLTTLGVELDGTDITSVLSLDGADFIYTPVEPLSAGEHTIRLVVLGGETQDKGIWRFTIGGEGESISENEAVQPSQAQIAAATKWLRGGSVEVDTLTEFSDRTFDNVDGNLPNSSIISGAGDVNTSLDGDSWEIRSRANYLVQTDKDLALTGNAVDLGEYDIVANFTGDTTKGGVILGHHDIGLQSNLFSNFYRRGASARLGTLDERVSAAGFAFRPESVSGARDFTGLNDSNNRLEGFTTSFKPFSNDIDALKVTGLYYNGEGDDGGTGSAVIDTTSEGSGWGVILEKAFGQGRWNARGEFASAEFDVDGNGSVANDDDGDAITLSIEGRPFESVVLMDESADIVLGARYDRIDTFFQSLANEGLANDREAVLLYSNLYWGSLSGNLQFLHETNNVDDLSSTPEDRLRNASLNLNYTFDQQQGRYSWLGMPYLNFNGFVADLDRLETPTGYTGLDTNSVTDSYTLGGGSNYENWYWNASHTLSQFEDHANAANDTVNNFTTLGAGWTVNERLNIDGNVSFGAFRDEDAGDATYDTNINLGAQAILLPEKLNLNFDYNLNLASGSGDIPDRHIANSEVEYTLLQPARNRPGVALAVRGSLEDENGNANGIQDDTDYRVFTVLRIKAPFGF